MGPERGATSQKAAFLLAVFSGLFLCGALLGDDDSPGKLVEDELYLTPATRQVIEKGLNYIASRQNAQGYWSGSEYELALSGMAGLALLGHGHPRRGKFGPHLRKYTQYLMAAIDDQSGYIRKRNEDRKAYAHAFSLLFLTQIYGMLDRDMNVGVKKKIKRLKKFIQTHQQPDGCWYQDYDPGGHNQIVTISQVQALRAANATGFVVPKQIIEKAVRFIEGFSFIDGTSPGRRASSIATLLAAGYYDHPRLKDAVKALGRELSRNREIFRLDDLNFPIFVHMYSAQVMYFLGGKDWQRYYVRFRDAVMKLRQREGSDKIYWERFTNVHAFSPTTVYSTANICLILQMPQDFLPFFQSVRADVKKNW
jgi:hypothetical protein